MGWIVELTGMVEMPNGDTYEVENGKLLDGDGDVIGTVEFAGAMTSDGETPTVDSMNINIDDTTVDVTD